VQIDVWEAWHQPVPDISFYNGLIVLGGTPNVNEEDRYPFLKVEKDIIAKAIEKDIPYLGFCLGHQLLADVLGARVGPNFSPSVGFTQGQLTSKGRCHPVLYGIPHSMPLFKWHTQAVLPPLAKEMEILLISPECEVEAISVRGRPFLVGLQSDNCSATVEDIGDWIKADTEWLQKLKIDTMKLMNDAKEKEALIGAQFDVLFGNFLKFVSRVGL